MRCSDCADMDAPDTLQYGTEKKKKIILNVMNFQVFNRLRPPRVNKVWRHRMVSFLIYAEKNIRLFYMNNLYPL